MWMSKRKLLQKPSTKKNIELHTYYVLNFLSVPEKEKKNYPNRSDSKLHLQTCQLFPKQALVFSYLHYKSYENTGKRRNCSQKVFSPIPTVFSILLENCLPFPANLKLSSAKSCSLK